MNQEQHRNGMQNNARGERERFRDPEGNYSRYPNQGHRPSPGGNPYQGSGRSQAQYHGQQYQPQGYNAGLSKPPDTGQAAPPQYWKMEKVPFQGSRMRNAGLP